MRDENHPSGIGRDPRQMMAVAAAGLGRRHGRRWVLAEVGFELPEGALAMLSGRNGSGKSTLLRVLATAIRADVGTAHVLGYDLRLDREEVRRNTALLGHRAHLYERLTALENLALAARLLDGDGRRAALLDRLEEVGLVDRADDAVQTFSTGMRQRLALARVLQQEARVVFLDEPYGHLDPQGFLLVDAVLRRLRARRCTVLMATHLLERARMLCDRSLILDEGRLVFAGATAEMPEGAVTGGAWFAEGA